MMTVLETLSLGGDDPNWWQAVIRGVMVYAVALLVVRIGEKRALGKSTAFDVVVAVMLGSVFSRGITGVQLGAALGGGAIIIFMHWLLSVMTFHSDRLGTLLKGSPRVLVEDGTIAWDAMRRSHISREDLLEQLRTEAHLDTVDDVKMARLERSGDISAIEKKSSPRVLTIGVAEGVQTVRLVLDG